MSTTTTAVRPPRASLPLVAVGGGLLVAVFDAVFACTWWAVAAGVGPMRILQSIGAGLLGEASFAGGWRSAAIGAAAHGVIATCMVGAYVFAAPRLPVLVRQPLRWGAGYGLFLYALMNFVVVPLSAAPRNDPPVAWVAASIGVHVLIGIACALLARHALGDQ